MPATNGLLSPPAPTEDESASQVMGKRKRSQETEQQHNTLVCDDNVKEEETSKGKFDDFLVDLLQVLRAHDTTPSILEQPIASAINEARSSKRVKLSTSSTMSSIASQIQSRAYHDIEELITDVNTAASACTNSDQETESIQVGPQDCRLQAYQFDAFKKVLESIIGREITQNPELIIQPTRDNDPSTIKNDAHEDVVSRPLLKLEGSGKMALTLYGTTGITGPNAAIPKQLFSSLQKPVKPNLSKASQTLEEDLPKNHGTIQLDNALLSPTIREIALPNGITTTKIIPVHSEESKDSKGQRLTFGDVFAPPASVPPMNPPKQSRHTSTRSQSVNWVTPGDVSAPIRSRSRESYTTQPLSTGHWLTYNVAPSPAQISSPVEKRKQRDRALSAGESKASFPEETIIAHHHAKEEALFKSAYSTFAPDHDDTAALVPQQLKNRLWWKRVGAMRYRRLMSQYIVDDSDSEVEVFNTEEHTEEDRLFKEAVDTWEPDEVPSDFDLAKSPDSDEKREDKDVEEILKEVSELLETLNSYQHVRNLSLATNARTTAGQNPQLTAMMGTPISPSEAEFDVYNILKSQLVLMISALPPYVVAKLNGDQLGALNISTRIHREGANRRGALEDYDAVAKARAPVPTPAAGPSARTTPQISVSGRSGNHQPPPSTTLQRPAYASSARPAAPSATYPSHQYSSRPTPSTSQYGSYSSQQPPTRQSYSAHQYGAQTPQPHSSQYSNGTRQYATQNGYSSYGQQHTPGPLAASPGAVQGSQFQRPSQPGYQQRAQNSQSYNHVTTPSARSASPPNAAASYTPQTQVRAAYSTPAPAPQSKASFAGQPVPQVGLINAAAVQANGAPKTIGQHLNLCFEEQAELVARQKAMIAEQDQLARRQGSGTPQPALANNGAPSNGSLMLQPNGITAGSSL
ncbi:hypothetical protein MMC13_005744 [Lambiella insularis]|nr:hypothetical protein [Lambiella insularis]